MIYNHVCLYFFQRKKLIMITGVPCDRVMKRSTTRIKLTVIAVMEQVENFLCASPTSMLSFLSRLVFSN